MTNVYMSPRPTLPHSPYLNLCTWSGWSDLIRVHQSSFVLASCSFEETETKIEAFPCRREGGTPLVLLAATLSGQILSSFFDSIIITIIIVVIFVAITYNWKLKAHTYVGTSKLGKEEKYCNVLTSWQAGMTKVGHMCIHERPLYKAMNFLVQSYHV